MVTIPKMWKSSDHLDHFQFGCLFFLNPFQPSVAFHIVTSHLICNANQMTGFYMKRNNWLKWVEDNDGKKSNHMGGAYPKYMGQSLQEWTK